MKISIIAVVSLAVVALLGVNSANAQCANVVGYGGVRQASVQQVQLVPAHVQQFQVQQVLVPANVQLVQVQSAGYAVQPAFVQARGVRSYSGGYGRSGGGFRGQSGGPLQSLLGSDAIRGLLPIGGAVGGAIVGGPLGAGLGAAVGGILAR